MVRSKPGEVCVPVLCYDHPDGTFESEHIIRSREHKTHMTEHHPLPLIAFHQGWEPYQRSLVDTIAPLSAEQLASPVAPNSAKCNRQAVPALTLRWGKLR